MSKKSSAISKESTGSKESTPSKTLIIAEKPSVARDLAKVLGKFENKKEYFENDKYIISSAVGHLVELFMPGDFDKKYKSWSAKTLPILPEKFLLKPIEKSLPRFELLKKLIERKDVNCIINACDAGREGELIFAYICELVHCEKEKKRLWMLSMTPDAIRDAFKHLRSNEEMMPLQNAARCRSESDWLVGINGTRAVTCQMGGIRNPASVGRVQTPTLTLVYEREKAIRNFKPEAYSRIQATFSVTSGEYTSFYQKASVDKNNDKDRVDRIWDPKAADSIIEEVKQCSLALVEDEKKRTKQSPPKLYDLTTLQREANNRYSFSAGKTLKIAQSLYEKHKAATYPRTDCKCLPEDYADTCRDVLKELTSLNDNIRGHFKVKSIPSCAQKVLDQKWVNPHNKRIFDNSEVTDHFAIIPTNEIPKDLSTDEAKIYEMIVTRFIAAFFPFSEFDVTTRISRVNLHSFKTEGKVLIKAGWLEVFGKEGIEREQLPPLAEADGEPPKAKVLSLEHLHEETSPPPRYTEATLLGAMEGAGKFVEDEELAEALKEKGLGTPATRAQTIDNLISSQYMVREGKELVPTAKAENIIEFLKSSGVEDLSSPSMTGEWEYKLRLIENSQLTREEFMKGINQMTSKIVTSILEHQESGEATRVTNIISPTDGQPLIETLRSFRSQDGKFTIYKLISNRKITEEEAAQLVSEKKVGPLTGFRSKAGKPFSASLELNAENQVRFVFDNQFSAEAPIGDLSQHPIISKCPVCKKGSLHETGAYYVCENQPNQQCTFRMSRVLLNRTIPREQILKLVEKGETDLLEGFLSKRTHKRFSAHVIMKPDGSIGFKFADRKPKNDESAAK